MFASMSAVHRRHAITGSLALILVLLVSMFGVIPRNAHAAADIFVKVSPSGTGTGASWANATTLQDALSTATAGDEIWVASGTYKPTAGTDRTATFDIPSGVVVYGGFDGTETDLVDRDLSGAQSILSGELGGAAITDNSYTVVEINSANNNTRLDGFVITRGYASQQVGDPERDNGGGMFVGGNSKALLVNLSFIDNRAAGSNNNTGSGGGMYIANSSPTLVNVVFSNNQANGTGAFASGQGGGLFVSGTDGGNLANLVNVTFSNNTAADSGDSLYASFGVSVNNSIFWNTPPSNDHIGGSANVSFSIVQQASGTYSGSGNLNADPQFVNPAANNVRLRPSQDGQTFDTATPSPAIDVGQNAPINNTGVTIDRDGHPRIFDYQDNDNPDRVDMGAYEYNDVVPENPTLSDDTLPENEGSGVSLGTFSVTDSNVGDIVEYEIVGVGSDANAFTIDSATGQISTAADFDFELKNSYSLELQATDLGGQSITEQYEITIENVNEPPTDIILPTTTVTENVSSALVGTLSTVDDDLKQPNGLGDTFTYSLVAGDGDDDNATFQIVNGNELRTDGEINFEDQDTFTVRIRSEDDGGLSFAESFTLNALNRNDTPTDITMSSTSVNENAPIGAPVGTFTTVDEDIASANDTHTYALVSGVGDTNNISFTIDGSTLRTNSDFDFEAGSNFSIRVETTDTSGTIGVGGGETFEKQFNITINDVNEIPTDISLSNDNVDENKDAGELIGTLSTTDQDTKPQFLSHTYTLVAGNTPFFQIVNGNELRTTQSFNYESTPSVGIRIRTTDQGGLFDEEQFFITVNDVSDDPTGISLQPADVDEDTASPATIGSLTTQDDDGVPPYTYTLVGIDNDNDLFTISGNQVQSKADTNFDFETRSSYTIQVESDDSSGDPTNIFTETLTITVNDVNEDPTDIALSPRTVADTAPAGTVIGNLSTIDPDTAPANRSHVYELLDDGGENFAIVGNELQVNGPLTRVSSDTDYTIRVRSTDQNGSGSSVEKDFIITVTDGNRPPTDITLSNNELREDADAGTRVGTLTAVDPDGNNNTYTYSIISGGNNFSIEDNALRLARQLGDGTYDVRVNVNDGENDFEKTFQITITPVQVGPDNQAPEDISLAISDDFNAGQPAGTLVGILSTDDPNPGDTHIYSLVAGEGDDDNALFDIEGDRLVTAEELTPGSYSIRIRTSDGELTLELVLNIEVEAGPVSRLIIYLPVITNN